MALHALERFIVAAKRATYVADGSRAEPSRMGSHDLVFGYITKPELIDPARAGATIKAALQEMYREGRFLGGFEWTGPHGVYRDASSGDVARFHGREGILVAATRRPGLGRSVWGCLQNQWRTVRACTPAVSCSSRMRECLAAMAGGRGYREVALAAIMPC